MEEENEEGMAEDHDHNTAVAAHQRVEEMMEGAVERVVLDTVAAAWVSPPFSLFPLQPFDLCALL